MLLSRIPLQYFPAAFIRDGGCRFSDSLVTPHHAYRVLHMAVQVAKTAKLIRICVLCRSINHCLYLVSGQVAQIAVIEDSRRVVAATWRSTHHFGLFLRSH